MTLGQKGALCDLPTCDVVIGGAHLGLKNDEEIYFLLKSAVMCLPAITSAFQCLIGINVFSGEMESVLNVFKIQLKFYSTKESGLLLT